MPGYWSPEFDRRRFLAGVGAAACTPGVFPAISAASGGEPADPLPHAIALISDTHIAADPARTNLGQNMAANLRQVVIDILSLPSRPGAVFLNGDLALDNGQSGDYHLLRELLTPLHDTGLPLHLGLGNHDDRSRFFDTFPGGPPAHLAVSSKHVSEVTLKLGPPEAARSLRVFVLDSLNVPEHVPGLLGPEQLLWLQDRLDAPDAANTPALVQVHHNPSDLPNALIDTDALLRLLGPRRQVKALIYGHTHVWSTRQQDDGLWRINLPAVAYPFSLDQPLGWVHFSPLDHGARLELRSVGGDLTRDRQVLELAWR